MRRTAIERFIQICKKDKFELKDYLEEKLKTKYDVVINGDGFLYAKGTIPFALTAHMDTVHKERVKQVVIENDEKTNHRIVSSPQGIGGDDRCGIYMILRIIDSGLLPTIIFCEDEEIGCVGSSKFAETEYVKELSDVNYIIELDRKGNNDAVFYDCDNPEFTKYITEKSGYAEAWGSMSDISVISPECMTASVNFSCGYYNPHTLQEYVDFEEMLATTEMVKTLLRDENAIHYLFIEKIYTYNSYKYGYEDYYGYYGDGFRNNGTSYYDQCDDYKYYMYAEINDNTTKKGYIDSSFCGDSPIECLCKLFFRFPHTTMSDVCYLEFYDADWALLSEMDLVDVLQIVNAYDSGDIPVIGNINR